MEVGQQMAGGAPGQDWPGTKEHQAQIFILYYPLIFLFYGIANTLFDIFVYITFSSGNYI